MPAKLSDADREAQCVRILDAIAAGISLKDACQAEGSVTPRAFQKWVAEDSQLAVRYEMARQEYAQQIADELIALSDTPPAAGATAVDIHHLRLRIDTRKWVVAKLLPRYNDKVQVEHSGTIDMGSTTDEELNASLVQVIKQLAEIAAGPRDDAPSGADQGSSTGSA